MTEIPEHLRKRAEEARQKAEAAAGGSDAEPSAEPSAAESKIPAHLLQRSKSAKSKGTEVTASAGWLQPANTNNDSSIKRNIFFI